MLTYNQMSNVVKEILRFNEIVVDQKTRESEEYLILCKSLVLEECEETMCASSLKDKLDGYCDIFVTAVQLAECPGIDDDTRLAAYARIGHALVEAEKTYEGVPMFDLYGALSEVNRSNMTKLPLLADVINMYGEDYQEAAIDYIESQGRYTGVYCVERKDPEGNVRVVFKSKGANNKVVKPWCFEEPNLTPYICKIEEKVLTEEQFTDYSKRVDKNNRVQLNDEEDV